MHIMNQIPDFLVQPLKIDQPIFLIQQGGTLRNRLPAVTNLHG